MQARNYRQMGAVIIGCFSVLLSAGCALAQAPASLPDDPSQPQRPFHQPTPTSRVEVYGAYSYLHPVQADINGFFEQPLNPGTVFGGNIYFTKHLGAELEGGIHPPSGANDCVSTAQGGLVGRISMRRFVPFVHALGGGSRVGGPVFQPCEWGWGVTTGFGIDYLVHGLGDHLAIRPIQADYEFNHVDHGPLIVPGGYSGGLMKMNAYRLSGGIVLRLGNMTPPTAASLSCKVMPEEVVQGDPVNVVSTGHFLDSSLRTVYTWNSTGGTLIGGGSKIEISTEGIPPGNYVVTGKVAQGSRLYQQADCTTHFVVKPQPQPPVVACSASPASVLPGGSSTISTVASSPDGRSLTYSYRATGGVITGNTSTATLSTGGSSTGTITVTCTVTDDRGKSKTATTSVQIVPPELPPAPKTQELCTIAFEHDTKRPARVDNEAKACLDDIALTLQRQSDAKLVVVGSRQPSESPDIAAERSVNTKLYLTHEKGIDPARISLRTGGLDGRRAHNTLVPAGAVYEATSGSMTVDESTVKFTGPAYGVPKARAKGKAKPRAKPVKK